MTFCLSKTDSNLRTASPVCIPQAFRLFFSKLHLAPCVRVSQNRSVIALGRFESDTARAGSGVDRGPPPPPDFLSIQLGFPHQQQQHTDRQRTRDGDTDRGSVKSITGMYVHTRTCTRHSRHRRGACPVPVFISGQWANDVRDHEKTCTEKEEEEEEEEELCLCY
ncbi:hypothetical protein ElyMa_002644700 [Elysia marginata]|uniref:Uncharacterized protein n=1 Tax=Elysia marginata TaxID=1093978 RepID=A0AAV4H9N9_9GAST|nr:hypothetical protein ElyMa_002644700 [Elysia marginata]